jgi:hypothetical protein
LRLSRTKILAAMAFLLSGGVGKLERSSPSKYNFC